MKRSFARRLTTHFVLTLGGSLAAVILVVSSVLFLVYVHSLNAQMAFVMERIPEIVRVYEVTDGDADAAVRAIATQVDNPALQVRAANATTRVILRPPGPDGDVTGERVSEQPRTEPEFPRDVLGDRLTFGLATALGLQTAHGRVLSLDVTVVPDDAVLDATVGRYAMGVVGLLLAVGLFAFFAARALTREALRPLNEVVAALETFAAGEVTPPRVELGRAENEFGRLATAYNAAAEHVASAFAERDRAEAQIRRFIADGAHQLRTPLTVIQGFISILSKGGPQSEPDLARIVQMMDRQSHVMAALIDKLTLLERWAEEHNHPEVVDIGECVHGIVAPLAAASRDREFVLAIEAGCYAFVDPYEVREAVANIVDNALKYSVPEPISVSVRGDEREVVIVVADRGPGMSEIDRARAFDRFYRGEKRSVVGSGLGLSLAKRAVERASGRIWIDGAFETGTAFSIALPRVDGAAEALPVTLPGSRTTFVEQPSGAPIGGV
ncbi:MAG TPA: HAMP domain-containing sensor histidine kinase [Candidatus Acidoferrum sp.]|nr:HAMP domain-containing sensor histidine kinase [Candidatus Acidoferrum sp.]